MEQKNCRCWPLSTHYFFYFTLLGTILPYLGLYLSSLKFSPAQIGELMAVFMLTKIVAPNIWGILSDRTGRPIFWVRVAALMATILSIGLLVFQTYWSLFFTLLVFSFFWHASLPQFESYTFKRLGTQKHRYGHIRLWGSIGFIVAVVLLGWVFEKFGIDQLPWVISGLLVLVWLSSYLVKDQQFSVQDSSLSEQFFAVSAFVKVVVA